MTIRIAVPLGEYQYNAAIGTYRIIPGMNRVVFRTNGCDWTCESQMSFLQSPILNPAIGVIGIAFGNSLMRISQQR